MKKKKTCLPPQNWYQTVSVFTNSMTMSGRKIPTQNCITRTSKCIVGQCISLRSVKCVFIQKSISVSLREEHIWKQDWHMNSTIVILHCHLRFSQLIEYTRKFNVYFQKKNANLVLSNNFCMNFGYFLLYMKECLLKDKTTNFYGRNTQQETSSPNDFHFFSWSHEKRTCCESRSKSQSRV